MGVWENITALFKSREPEFETRSFSDTFEVKKAFDALSIGVKGRPQYPATDTEALLKWQKRNEIVFACLQKKAQAAQDPIAIVERKGKDGKFETIEGHPLANLLAKPNPVDDGGTFLGAWLNSEDLTGAFYAEIVRSSTGQPVQLWALNPANIYPVAGDSKTGSNIAGFEYKIGNQKILLRPEDVLFRKNKDLTSQFDGLAPVEACLGSIDADGAMTDYVRAFLNNGGVPSGVLKFPTRTLTDEQAEIYRQKWANRYGRGARGQKGIAVLDQNAEYQQIGAVLKEIESDSTRGQSEARICGTLGVPPILISAYVGLVHVNQRASVREAQNDFWINTLSPLFKSLRNFLTWNLLPEFEPIEAIQRGDVRVGWDMSHVLGLQEDVDKRYDRAIKAFEAGGITLNEFRELIDFPADPEGDYYIRSIRTAPRTPEMAFVEAEIIPAALASAEQIAAAEANPEAVGATDDATAPTSDAQTAKAAKIPAHAVSRALPAAKKTFEYDGLQLSREPNELEKKLGLKKIDAAFESNKQKIQSVLEGLRKSLIEQAIEAVDGVAAKELSAVNLTPPPQVFTKLRKQIKAAFEDGRTQAAATLAGKKNAASIEIKSEDGGDDFDEITDLTVSRVVNDVQTRAISQAAQLAMLGLAADELKSRLKSALDDGSTGYLSRAAGGAANTATADGRQAEYEARSDDWDYLYYSAILDKNTCDPCGEADGQEGASYDDLPDTPNPDCEGGDLCRCFIIAVSK